jgi:hypothetical protein
LLQEILPENALHVQIGGMEILEVIPADRHDAAPKCLQNGAVSTGRCNTGLKFTCGSFKAQSFPRALIEAQRYFVEIGENCYVA